MNAYTTLALSLAWVALLGVGYRFYRYRNRRGPLEDFLGQVVLGVVLLLLAAAATAEVGAIKWTALGFGLIFGVVVMPIWILAVFIPGEPRKIDYWFVALYYLGLVATVVAALAAP